MAPSRKPGPRVAHDLRRRLADEAARLIIEDAATPAQALRKAAGRLGIGDNAHGLLPGADDIDAAVQERLRLFAVPGHATVVHALRQAAAEAMRFFHAFHPRLAGPVLEGTAVDARSPVQLHLHCDEPDTIARLLQDEGIPAHPRDRTIRLRAGGQGSRVPGWSLQAGGTRFDLLVLPLQALRQPPREDLGEAAIRRADLAEVRALLGAHPDTPHPSPQQGRS